MLAIGIILVIAGVATFVLALIHAYKKNSNKAVHYDETYDTPTRVDGHKLGEDNVKAHYFQGRIKGVSMTTDDPEIVGPCMIKCGISIILDSIGAFLIVTSKLGFGISTVVITVIVIAIYLLTPAIILFRDGISNIRRSKENDNKN